MHHLNTLNQRIVIKVNYTVTDVLTMLKKNSSWTSWQLKFQSCGWWLGRPVDQDLPRHHRNRVVSWVKIFNYLDEDFVFSITQLLIITMDIWRIVNIMSYWLCNTFNIIIWLFCICQCEGMGLCIFLLKKLSSLVLVYND